MGNGNRDNKNLFKDAYGLKNAEQTKAHYAKWADSYDREIGEDKGYRQPQRCAEALVKVLPVKNAKILDIGCGTGLSGIALNNAGYRQIDGCDFSPEMLEKAGDTGAYDRLFETDLNHPPLPVGDAIYDGVTCVGVFSFGHVMPDALDDILRVLKPKGILVIGLNDHYFQEGDFPNKIDQLVAQRHIRILDKSHGLHLEHVENSTGWVFTCLKH